MRALWASLAGEETSGEVNGCAPRFLLCAGLGRRGALLGMASMSRNFRVGATGIASSAEGEPFHGALSVRANGADQGERPLKCSGAFSATSLGHRSAVEEDISPVPDSNC